MAKMLYGQDDKRFDQEYWGWLERNWRQWKEGQRKEEEVCQRPFEKKRKSKKAKD